jgi:hypothetical protein
MKRFAILAALVVTLLCASTADARYRNRVRLLIVERPVVVVESVNFLAVRSFAVREVVEFGPRPRSRPSRRTSNKPI